MEYGRLNSAGGLSGSRSGTEIWLVFDPGGAKGAAESSGRTGGPTGGGSAPEEHAPDSVGATVRY